MKLPYWLLRLLPMWDYICPRCRREVKPNSHQCPYCGERFPFPLRVPPKCLKRKEDLERYVHEKIFPKISDWQREYLAQYFTTIFQSGFETGDFSEWTATEQPNGIASVQSITKHHGNYAAKFETTSTAVGSYAAAYKNIAATSLVYMRFYLYLDNLPGVNNSRLLYGQLHNVANGYILLFYVNRGSIGNLRWELRLWTGGTLVSYYSANENIQTNQWYCVEMKLKVHGTQGEIALWIDGVQKIAQTGLDTDDRGNVDRVYVTCFISTTAQDAFKSCKIDCVVVADTYTGPEFKQWSQTLNIVHMLERPFRSIRLMQALKAAYVYERPTRIMSLTHTAEVTHLFSRPKRTFKLSQALQMLHMWAVTYPALILKQWSGTLQINHTFKRPFRQMKFEHTLQTIHAFMFKRFFKLIQALSLVHVLRRPYRRLGYTQMLQPTHVFSRPVRIIRLPATLHLTHVFSRPLRLFKLFGQLGLVHAYYAVKPGAKAARLIMQLGPVAVDLSTGDVMLVF